MIKNYLKVAFRSIIRSKLTSIINIAGLSIAMACAVLIYLFIADEISFDRYNSKIDRTYRVTRNFFSREGVSTLHLATVAPPIGPLLKNDFGEIQKMARTLQNQLVVGLEENGELKKSFTENEVFLTEPDLFDIFDIELKSGEPKQALSRPFTIMLSEKSAHKYFNDENVIGKRLRLNNQFDLEVTGVFKDFPLQSHWHPEFLVSFVTLEDDKIYGRNGLETNWGNNSFSTYILLEPGADAKKLEAAMPSFLDKHFGPYAKANWGVSADWVASKSTELNLQKVADIHLKSHLDDEIEAGGNINNVYMMGTIGLFIILIACFNFVNLSTARATKRAKEVGMRKVVGALKSQLVKQYLSESIMIAMIALLFTLAICLFVLTWLNHFTGKELTLNFGEHWSLFIGMIAFAVLVGVLAGIYPAFVISSFKPSSVLKGSNGTASGKGSIRKALVITQFSISIVLIIATVITSQQLSFLTTSRLGYNKDQVIRMKYPESLTPTYESFYNELTKSASIRDLTRSSRIPTGRLLDSKGYAFVMKGDSMVRTGVELKYIAADQEFFNTYGMEMAAGRSFSKSIKTDDTLAYIINEAAVKALGWKSNEEGIDKDFKYGDVKGKLVGVVKDFHFESLHQRIVPMIFLPVKQSYYNVLSVKIAGNNAQAGIAHLEKVWRQLLPEQPFDYEFLSERYAKLYSAEQKENQLFSIFSGMAILIACLGLFGLATFNTMQRIKEIGIRKVLGASVPSILTLLSKEVVVLVLLANAVAWPIAWYLLNQWLSGFAYHIDMNILIYILSAVAAVTVALLTVSAQTLRAATMNPSKTLRYE